MNRLETRALGVSLGGRRVVEEVSITVESGEFIGLIGPNGAGKTTFMKAVLGLVAHEGGIFLSGQDNRQLDERKRSRLVSYLPQEREVNWPLPVEKVVALGRAYAGDRRLASRDRGAERIEEAMSRMGISHLRGRAISELSGGEQARVLIARALAQDAPLLLADEPTAGLDPAHQITLMQRLLDMTKEGGSVIACLHEIPLAARWCTRIVVFDRGGLAADGKPAEVLQPELMRRVYGVEIITVDGDEGLFVVPSELSRN